MRIYNQEQKLVKIVCNCCGHEASADHGLLKEDFVSVDKQWGYFSDKDMQVHHFDLCEACYDQMIQSFKLPVDTDENLEPLGQ